MKRTIFVLLIFSTVGYCNVNAASFDCKKASMTQEKLICSDPVLNAADEKLGEAYKVARKNFPVKKFISLSQKAFLLEYRYCAAAEEGRERNIEFCLGLAKERTEELLDLATANVYSDKKGKFTVEDLVITISTHRAPPVLRYWGHWMPDAYRRKPFPDGFLCHDNIELKLVDGRLIAADPDIKILINNDKISIGDILCSARNEPVHGDFFRVN